MSRPYVNSLPWRNRKMDGYADKTEAFTVPGAANDYTVELDERIVPNGTLVVVSDGDTLTPVPYGIEPGMDQVAVSYDLPLLKFHSSRESETGTVEYTPGGGVITSSVMADVASDPEWGDIGGTLADQVDLDNALDGKANAEHTHEIADVDGLDSILDTIDNTLDVKQPLDSDLTAIAGLATTGLIARTGTGTAAARTITAGDGVSVVNGNGAAANPTVAVDSTVARRNATNTFSALQTFNLGAVLKGLVFPATELNAHSANVNYQVLASDTMLVLGNNNASYTLNITLPAPVVGKFIWVFNSGALVNAPVFDTGSGSVLFTWAGGGFTQTYNGEQGDHKMTILYCANASRWRAIAL